MEEVPPPRRTRTRQTRQRKVKPIPEKPRPKPPLSPRLKKITTTKETSPRGVTLRSTTLTYSSDEDEKREDMVQSLPKVLGRSRTFGLSETRFRERFNDIRKERVVSSTPFVDPSTTTSTTTTTTKVRLDFDRSFPRRSARMAARVHVEPSVVEEDDVVEEEEVREEEIVEEEVVDAPDGRNLIEKRTVIEEETWIAEDDSDQRLARQYVPRSFLFDVGWKELVLACFVTGLGAVGYICYVTDICNMCL